MNLEQVWARFTGRALPGGWTFLVDLTRRTVVRTSGDPTGSTSPRPCGTRA